MRSTRVPLFIVLLLPLIVIAHSTPIQAQSGKLSNKPDSMTDAASNAPAETDPFTQGISDNFLPATPEEIEAAQKEMREHQEGIKGSSGLAEQEKINKEMSEWYRQRYQQEEARRREEANKAYNRYMSEYWGKIWREEYERNRRSTPPAEPPPSGVKPATRPAASSQPTSTPGPASVAGEPAQPATPSTPVASSPPPTEVEPAPVDTEPAPAVGTAVPPPVPPVVTAPSVPEPPVVLGSGSAPIIDLQGVGGYATGSDGSVHVIMPGGGIRTYGPGTRVRINWAPASGWRPEVIGSSRGGHDGSKEKPPVGLAGTGTGGGMPPGG